MAAAGAYAVCTSSGRLQNLPHHRHTRRPCRWWLSGRATAPAAARRPRNKPHPRRRPWRATPQNPAGWDRRQLTWWDEVVGREFLAPYGLNNRSSFFSFAGTRGDVARRTAERLGGGVPVYVGGGGGRCGGPAGAVGRGRPEWWWGLCITATASCVAARRGRQGQRLRSSRAGPSTGKTRRRNPPPPKPCERPRVTARPEPGHTQSWWPP